MITLVGFLLESKEGQELTITVLSCHPKPTFHDGTGTIKTNSLTPTAANERTYLGYLRTAVALSVLGVTVAQLYRLQHAAAPDAAFGYFVLSKPVAGLFQGSALVVTLIGAGRFYRQQHAMAVGKVRAGGWEVYLVSVFVLFVRTCHYYHTWLEMRRLLLLMDGIQLLIGMFAVHVGIDVYKTD